MEGLMRLRTESQARAQRGLPPREKATASSGGPPASDKSAAGSEAS